MMDEYLHIYSRYINNIAILTCCKSAVTEGAAIRQYCCKATTACIWFCHDCAGTPEADFNHGVHLTWVSLVPGILALSYA